MKILERSLKKGLVKVLPESADDLWHLYNLINQHDKLYARTTRSVKIEEDYARPKEGKRISVFLGITVENVFWDRFLNRLRVHGIVCDAPEKVNIKGARHTINVSLDTPITLVKSNWSKHQIDRLDQASQVQVAPIIVLSIDYAGYSIATLRQYGIDINIDEKVTLPGKREVEKRTTAIRDLFKNAFTSLRNVWNAVQGPIVIIGSGFVKNEYVKYLQSLSSDIAQQIVDVKSVNSSGVAGVHEALRSGVLSKALKHVRIVEETKMMETVLTRLGKGRLDVTYGFVDAERASLFGAIDTLLLADATLREAVDETRVVLEQLMRRVEAHGGQIMVLSIEHEAGKNLLSLGGVAALLRFPLEKGSS